jgi:hypothetical protein
MKTDDFSSEPNGQTEWFNSLRPAQFDSELEMLCSGAFGGDDVYVFDFSYKNLNSYLKNSSITKLYTC